ncbi:MAG: hypothetical protein IPP56_14655 [Bacteroidetes bacterium]|nr:hypothetical protein [Bacteroidota bacterium]MBK9672787.1 hypothetical protein [Bacteroidota bacterium]MBK9800902.1 hypothetical protein [Bacteroidota bacterium]MBP6412046.1 hypothetical protein [Bacteroidia bacterium]
MKINIQIPSINNENKIIANISCVELGASSTVEVDFENLLPFVSSDNMDAVDLFLLSTFVYGIDRFIDRHSFSVDGWSRKLEVKFPVYNLSKWNGLNVKMEELLSFLTGDYWRISFYKNKLNIPLIKKPHGLKSIFKQVNLFSGGLDSLIGAIDFLTDTSTEKLLVISHFDPHISARKEQNYLRSKLIERYSDKFNFVPSVSVSLSISNIEKEKTFRSRSFLFIGIAVLVANYNKIPIMVPENGTVSLNFPLSSSRRSACSTRTTHPSFLNQTNELLALLNFDTTLNNIYDLKTKGEMVKECKDLPFLKTIVAASNSCGKRGHRANWTLKNKDHCGVCMPCIYRQAALQTFADGTEYGNSIKKKFTGRNNQTPFLLSKQGQDFGACLDFLRKPLTNDEIRNELLVNGINNLEKLDRYVELVNRTRVELCNWIKKEGDPFIKKKAGLK